ncbi:MAG: His/Gly/Thr/Pro-type tRNA ligase C-terminal domain-containing protein, partial [Eubacterium aggregans]
TYVGSDGEKHRQVIIHRTIFGSIERFFGILIEHFAGKFPLWLAPVQVELIPVSDKHDAFARKIAAELQENDIRVDIDFRDEKIGYRIREAQMQKVPYMLVIGDKEMEGELLTIRNRDTGEQEQLTLEAFQAKLKEGIGSKGLTLK